MSRAVSSSLIRVLEFGLACAIVGGALLVGQLVF